MTDPRERSPDLEENLRIAVERALSRVWTALPAIVVEDSADGHVVKIKSAIKMQQRMEDGSVKNVEIGAGSDGKSVGWGHVPIQFPSGGGLVHTFPIKKDQEGILVVSARAIDGWWQNGGVQPQPESRRHNLSDCFFIPGVRSNPKKLANVSANSSQLRTEDGKAYAEVFGDGSKIRLVTDAGAAFFELTSDHVLNIKAPGGVNIDAPNVACTHEVTGNSGGGSSVKLTTHHHSGVQTGGAQTGNPVPGT